MENIAELLKARLAAAQNNTLATEMTDERKEYNKKWAEAVQFFQKYLNEERIKTKSGQPQLSFIAVRSKLAHVNEISDLRWFYKQCLIYKFKKKGNTFGKCFFGALKIK